MGCASGGMAEWTNATVLKTVMRLTHRGFESHSLRQCRIVPVILATPLASNPVAVVNITGIANGADLDFLPVCARFGAVRRYGGRRFAARCAGQRLV